MANTTTFSIAANVSAADSEIIKHTIPNWLRVFRQRLGEVLLVVDEHRPVGRMLKHHDQTYRNCDLYSAIETVQKLDARIHHTILDYDCAPEVSLRWFKRPDIIRCQSGSPIFGYAYAIETARCDVVLRLDCDMLFFENGWLTSAVELLESQKLDLLEPPKLGMSIHRYQTTVSTGAFMVKRSSFLTSCLPMKPYRLDLVRRFHRTVAGRSRYLSLEEILKKEKSRGHIRHALLDEREGFSVHVWSRAYASRPELATVISAIEKGSIPKRQELEGWNLVLEFWPNANGEDMNANRMPERNGTS